MGCGDDGSFNYVAINNFNILYWMGEVDELQLLTYCKYKTCAIFRVIRRIKKNIYIICICLNVIIIFII